MHTRKYSRVESFNSDQTYKNKRVDFKLRLLKKLLVVEVISGRTRLRRYLPACSTNTTIARRAWISPTALCLIIYRKISIP
nr:hypothetical protein [Sodalis-like endosymbiont of Proechinophthirus fluctus]